MNAGLFLTGRALKWFKPYLTEIQVNEITTLNQEVRYIFLSWEGFASQLTQIYSDMETAAIAEKRLSELTQKGLVTDYTTTFQIYAKQTEWNQKALMARYKQGLKWKVQDVLIYILNTTTM